MSPQIAVSLIILSRCFFLVNKFFSSFLKIFSSKRRRRDLNPRAAVNDLHPFQGCPFGQLGYFSEYIILFNLPFRKNKIHRVNLIFAKRERRGWDSNPRALADKRFSRPPRYDHFDTSAYSLVYRECCVFLSASEIISLTF